MLCDLLMQSSLPLRKEEIIEKIWGRTYHPDLNDRFYKLMERLKKNTNAVIYNQNSSYLLKRF